MVILWGWYYCQFHKQKNWDLARLSVLSTHTQGYGEHMEVIQGGFSFMVSQCDQAALETVFYYSMINMVVEKMP